MGNQPVEIKTAISGVNNPSLTGQGGERIVRRRTEDFLIFPVLSFSYLGFCANFTKARRELLDIGLFLYVNSPALCAFMQSSDACF